MSGTEFLFTAEGKISVTHNGKLMVSPSYIGKIKTGENVLTPAGAEISDDRIVLSFDGGIRVALSLKHRNENSIRLEVTEIPDSVDSFVYGPYVCEELNEVGDMIGAAWKDDGSVVCIQSLNPKTVGGDATVHDDEQKAAKWTDREKNTAYICCSANNMSYLTYKSYNGMKDAEVLPVEGPDGHIAGSAIALICADNADALLDDIGNLEIEENMPHPTLDGVWAKKSVHANDIYLITGTFGLDKQIELAEKAGVHWIYLEDPFESWGHFEISKDQYPGGIKELKETIDKAEAKGVHLGFHTLTNFIHTYDSYVTPAPSDELLVVDRTQLTEDVDDSCTEMKIAEEKNYSRGSKNNCFRIGDELVIFGRYDAETKSLKDCKRGAYGTKAAAHKAGDELDRLWDHGYATFFPDINNQYKMADRIADIITKTGFRRLSFDGVEGCTYTGRGEYACSEYVRRIYEKCGGELLSDASQPSHYRWHAHSYFNWGEPWYDSARTGGGYYYRARNQQFFRRNLMPGMLGWYLLGKSTPYTEATTPEVMDYILSRTVAFNAGLCVTIQNLGNGKLDEYLGKINKWERFRREVKVPDEIIKDMQNRNNQWRLDETDGEWILTELDIINQALGHTAQASLDMESGTGYSSSTANVMDAEMYTKYESNCILDEPCEQGTVEKLNCRIRIGKKGDKKTWKNLAFYSGWYGGHKFLSFNLNAEGGDYLILNADNTLDHCDSDFNLIERLQGEGEGVNMSPYGQTGLTVHFSMKEKPTDCVMTVIRTKHKYVFKK